MKRNFKLLVAVVVLATLVMTLASCDVINGIVDKINPKPHEHTYSADWSSDETNHWHAATCQDTEECGSQKSDVAPHTYADGKCSVCGAADPNYTPVCTEHAYGAPVETKAPTCTEKGEKTLTCTVCGETMTQEVAANGHTEVELEGKAPTCTEAGLSKGKKCSVCDTILTAQETIPATNHNYVEGVCSACNAEDPNYNGPKTYVLDANDLENKAKIDEDGFHSYVVAGSKDFFTIYLSKKTEIKENKKTFEDGYVSTKRIGWNTKTVISEDEIASAIEMNITGTATVKIWWVSGGYYTVDDVDVPRQIAIYDENGNIVTKTDVADPGKTDSDTDGVKNNLFISELTISKPGKYYLGNVGNSNYYFKVEVVETPIEKHPATVTTTDNNCWVDKVTFTATGEGLYTFYLPAGLGAWEASDCDTFPPVNGPYVDYYDNTEGASFAVGLEAGATLEFYVASTEKKDWAYEWTYVACDVEDAPVAPPAAEKEDLVVGSNSIVLGEADLAEGKDYNFVVTEEGTYSFGGDLLAIVFDSTGMMIGRGQASLAAGTYTVKFVSMNNVAGTYTVNVSVAGADSGSTTEPDGSENNPYVWETLPESATADGDATNKFFYSFTASANGTLTVTYATANSWWTLTDKTDASLSTEGSKKDVNTMTLVSGHEYVLGLGAWDAETSDPTVTISFTEGTTGGDGEDDTTCQHDWWPVWFHEDKVAATCITGGVDVYQCDLCGEYKTEATEPDTVDGHDYVTNMETYKAATCLADGFREATCSYCGDHQEYVLSSEDYGYHDWVLDEATFKEPTCKDDGYAHSVCSVCKEEKTEEEPASAFYHVIEYSSNYSVQVCSVCGETTFASLSVDATETTYGVRFNTNYMGVALFSIWNADYSINQAFAYTVTLADGVYTLTLNNIYENEDTLGLMTATITVKPACTGILLTITPAEGDALTYKNYEVEHADLDGDYLCDGGCKTILAPAADSTLTISQAAALGSLFEKSKYTADSYWVEGVIDSINSEGTMTIKDADGNTFYIYKSNGADGTWYSNLKIKHVKGDTVKVYGAIGKYDIPQMQYGKVTVVSHEHVYADATCTAPKSCACGATEGDKLDHVYGENGKCECGAELGSTTYSHVLASGDLAIGTVTLSDVAWTLETSVGADTYFGWDGNASAKGVQIGKSAAPATSAKLTSAAFEGVTKIVINVSGAKDISGTAVVKVGDTTVGTINLTSTATDYTFELTDALSGPVVIEFAQTTSKGLYVKSIQITY